jgi:23S rRNA (uracil1939-C5)-methyltransferase
MNMISDNNSYPQVVIESIDIDGKGIAHINGKTIFVDDVLPDELVKIDIYKHKNNYAKARVVEFIIKSPERVEALCPHYGVCGGCVMQHIESSKQIIYKQQVLIEKLQHLGKTTPQNIQPAIITNHWHYRNRARLSVRYVAKKDSVLIGFHEKNSRFIADINTCLILPQHIANLITPLRKVLRQLSIFDKLPQIEVAVGDKLSVLVLRIMQSLNSADELLLRDFIDQHSTNHKIQLWLQPGDQFSCYPFYPLDDNLQLNYTHSQLVIPFMPTDFTQVNHQVNELLVQRAIKLLNLNVTSVVLDLFCGIGNFTLAIAQIASKVTGIDGNEALISRAYNNAKLNRLEHKVDYLVTNLFSVTAEYLIKLGKFSHWLIDPPRDGAMALIQAITKETAPEIIVYVSCNIATLARDSNLLVNVCGYTMQDAGVINMFPHTAHVESIAVFRNLSQ